ncbi:MAG: hypothetical protein R6W75_10850 [Smithellaceae bacterium]
MLSLKTFFQDRYEDFAIGEIAASAALEKNFEDIKIKISRKLGFSLSKRPQPTIRILTHEVQSRLYALDPCEQESYVKKAAHDRILLLLFSQTSDLPDSIKKICEKHAVPASGSTMNEHLLYSRLQSLRQERIRFLVRFHGVLVETAGKGLLIKGPSGIGKTSGALKFAGKGNYWIADDLVIIRKSKNHQLKASGHPKIRQYFHTPQTGIAPVLQIMDKSDIKKTTPLKGMIELFYTDDKTCVATTQMKIILETPVKCVNLPIFKTGFFNENLLKKAIEHLDEAIQT